MRILVVVGLMGALAAMSSASAIGAESSSETRQLTGTVISVGGGSIKVRSQSRSLTCAVVSRGGLRTFAAKRVRLTCRTVGGRLTATRIRTLGGRQSIEVNGGRAEVRGKVSSVAGGSVTVGLGQSSFSCRVPGGLDLALFLGRTVELECSLVAGTWTVDEIETEDGVPAIEVDFRGDDDNDDDEDHSGPGRGDDDDDGDHSGRGSGGDDD
jgi:hypothetical protein